MRQTDENPADGYVGTSEAARILGVSVRTIYRYEADGHLKAHRTPTGHRRFRVSDVEAVRDTPRTAPASRFPKAKAS